MGKDLGDVFTVLANELTFLSWQWTLFSDLYLKGPKRFEIMNRAAPFFFWVLQRSWWDEALLSVTRLLGPTISMGQANLTFQRLAPLIPDATLSTEIATAVSNVIDKAGFAKPWRNKRIAHRDLDVALQRAQPLPAAKYAELDAVLKDMASILNQIQMHYLNSSTIYGRAPITHGSTELLYVLRDGLKLEDLRQKRLEEHKYDPDEWNDNDPAI